MQEKKFIDDYTLTELYNNFQNLEKNFYELRDTSTFKSYTNNDLLSRLEFVKCLHKYKKYIELIPGINKYADGIIDAVLRNVQSVKTITSSEQPVEFIENTHQIHFNSELTKPQAFRSLIGIFTKMGFNQEMHQGINAGITKAHMQYISNSIDKLQGNSVLETNSSKVYSQLYELFGSRLINLNTNTAKEFLRTNTFPKEIHDLLNVENPNNIFEYFNKEFDPNLDIATKKKIYGVTNSKYLDLKLIASKNMFKSLLAKTPNISEKSKSTLNSNLEDNVLSIINVNSDIMKKENANGLYFPSEKEVHINEKISGNTRTTTILHELMHAATTSYHPYNYGSYNGFVDSVTNFGAAFNEGATEYFSNKIFSQTGQQPPYIAYKPLVAVIKDLVNLYGENTILEAMLHTPNHLSNLMQQDGKDYIDLRNLSDDYYKLIYKDKDNPYYKKVKTAEAKASYKKILVFINEIYKKRNIADIESECTKSFNETYYPKALSKVSSLFKKATHKIKSFFKQEKPLLLNEDTTFQIQNNSDFINNIKVTSINSSNHHNNELEKDSKERNNER